MERVGDEAEILFTQVLMASEVEPVLADVLCDRELAGPMAHEVERSVLSREASEQRLALDPASLEKGVQSTSVLSRLSKDQGERMGGNELALTFLQAIEEP